MNEPSFPRYQPPHHHLNPTAQEFFPSTILPSNPHQIFYSIPSPQHFPPSPAYLTEPPPVIPPTSPSAPSRTLLLSMVPSSVSESTVRRDLEVFGDVRAVQMERRRQGLVTVHFYDIRDSQAALMAIQQQHMQNQLRIGQHYQNPHMVFIQAPARPPFPARGLISGRVVWAQFDSPVTSGLPDGNNQGTLVVFNLDTRVSPQFLQEVFEAFGPVKELRETPMKRHQRFIEFYDVRSAALAFSEMNGKEIYGRAITIDYSRPGGFQSKKMNNVGSRNGGGSIKFSQPFSRPFASPSTPPLVRKSYGQVVRSGSEGSKSSSSNGSSILQSVGKLCIYDQDFSNVGGSKRNSVKKVGDFGSGSSKMGVVRPWKGGAVSGGRNEHDTRFLINEDGIMDSNCRDLRTTVMIKNIPNKYSQKLLLNMLDNHCIHCNEQIANGEDDQPLSSYDFVYLPIDFINKCNVGYGFVNMTSPEATLRLYKAFHLQSWEVFNSKKICDVTYARLQGLDALREHFKNSKFPGETEEYMPVVFDPPRDGRRITDPSPIFGCQADLSSSLSPPSTAGSSRCNRSVNDYDEEDEDGSPCDGSRRNR